MAGGKVALTKAVFTLRKTRQFTRVNFTKNFIYPTGFLVLPFEFAPAFSFFCHLLSFSLRRSSVYVCKCAWTVIFPLGWVSLVSEREAVHTWGGGEEVMASLVPSMGCLSPHSRGPETCQSSGNSLSSLCLVGRVLIVLISHRKPHNLQAIETVPLLLWRGI